jgi:hypothetical protein
MWQLSAGDGRDLMLATVQRFSRRSTLSAEMPKEEAMAQLSRPFQIVLVVFALLAAVWFVALRGPSGGSSTPAPSASASAPVTVVHASNPAAPSSVYHGAAPGVEGLTRAIAKAHAAVRTSQENAEQLAEKSAAASSSAGSAVTTQQAAASAAPVGAAAAAAPGRPTATTPKPAAVHVAAAPASSAAKSLKSKAAEAQSGPARTPARQALVERALKEGKVAVILFWNRKGADDLADQFELRLLEEVHHLIPSLTKRVPALRAQLKRSGLELEKKFAAFEASASQVTSFGSITRGIQVNGTPTILIVNARGQVTTLTGLTDAYSIEQSIDEARHR